MKRHWLCLF